MNGALRAAVPADLTIALYQPDIPQNAGTILRMCACLGFGAAIIEPAGFPSATAISPRRHGLSRSCVDRALRLLQRFRGGQARIGRTPRPDSTKASLAYTSFCFEPGDILLLGRESAGAPPEVHASATRALRSAARRDAFVEYRGRRGDGRWRGDAPDRPCATGRRRRRLTGVNLRRRRTAHPGVGRATTGWRNPHGDDGLEARAEWVWRRSFPSNRFDAMSATDSLQQRLDFIDFDADARAALRSLKPLIEKALPPALAVFYEKVRKTPQLSAFSVTRRICAPPRAGSSSTGRSSARPNMAKPMFRP